MTRPVAVGYVAAPAHASDGDVFHEVDAWRSAFAAYVGREGYALGPVFSDRRGRGENGLYGLLEYVKQTDADAVVVPHIGHLTHGDCLSGADRRTAQRFLHAPVLTVENPPPAAVAVTANCAPM